MEARELIRELNQQAKQHIGELVLVVLREKIVHSHLPFPFNSDLLESAYMGIIGPKAQINEEGFSFDTNHFVVCSDVIRFRLTESNLQLKSGNLEWEQISSEDFMGAIGAEIKTLTIRFSYVAFAMEVNRERGRGEIDTLPRVEIVIGDETIKDWLKPFVKFPSYLFAYWKLAEMLDRDITFPELTEAIRTTQNQIIAALEEKVIQYGAIKASIERQRAASRAGAVGILEDGAITLIDEPEHQELVIALNELPKLEELKRQIRQLLKEVEELGLADDDQIRRYREEFGG